MVREPLVGVISRLVTGVTGMAAQRLSCGKLWRRQCRGLGQGRASSTPVTSDGAVVGLPYESVTGTMTGFEGGLGALQEANRCCSGCQSYNCVPTGNPYLFATIGSPSRVIDTLYV